MMQSKRLPFFRRPFLSLLLTVLCVGAALLHAGPAAAELVPSPGTHDSRLKVVTYSPDNIVLVKVRFGYVTDIQFAQGESVIGGKLAMGDSSSWKASPALNHLFVKPTEEDAQTNMTVITTAGRIYQFLLVAMPPLKGHHGTTKSDYFQVAFRYPQAAAAAQAAAKARSKIAAQALKKQKELTDAINHPKLDIHNLNYYACGDKDVTPNEAFDNGRFTFMRYAGNRKIPAIFAITDSGTEELVNAHVDSTSRDTVVIHRLAKRFVFRLGKSVGCLVNKSYDPNGIDTFNDTSLPGVKRILKGKAPN